MPRPTVSYRLPALGALLVFSVLSCVEQAEDKPTAEDMEIVKKNLLDKAPTPQFAANADLDGKVVFIGMDASPNPAEAGKDVKLTFYWQVKETPGEGWRTFTHAEGPNRAGYMNLDHGPIRGKHPVHQWKPGQIIRDEHSFRVPATWQFDNIQIYVGLWKRADRMKIVSGPKDPEGRVIAATLPVKGAVQPAPAKKYLVRKVAKAPKIDGKLDEPAWKTAPGVGVFVDTLTGAPAKIQTDAKLLWDDKTLYIAFENVDTDIWSNLEKRDDKLWTQEAVELMIDADGDKKNYIELQVAPNGTVFDTFLPEWRKYENDMDPKRKPFDWNSKVKAAVSVDGTLNKRGDQDKGWTVEIALPLADVNGLAQTGLKLPPALGDTWRINMFRLDMPQGKEQLVAGWSPPMVGDFHALDRFGQIVFANEKGDVPAPAAPAVQAHGMTPPAPAAGAPGTDPHGTGAKAVGGAKAKAERSAAVRAAFEGIQKPQTEPGGTMKLEGHKAPASKTKRPAETEKK
jgi:hypothetical protein